jgi:hypothetical protein
MNPKIKKGYFNIFQVFQLFQHKNSKSDFSNYLNLIKSLINSGLIISADSPNKEVSFQGRFEEYLSQRNRDFREIGKNYNGDITKIAERPTVKFSAGYDYMEVESDINDKLEESQNEYIGQLVALYQLEEIHTGIPTKDYKNRFLLFPSKITLEDGSTRYIGIYLTVFKHGYGIIHLCYDIDNQEFGDFNFPDWEVGIQKAMVPEILINGENSYSLKKKARVNSLNQLVNVYREYIEGLLLNNLSSEYKTNYYNLCLSDYAYQPDDYENEPSKNYNETLFKLLFAPITEYSLKSTNDITSFVSSRYFSFSKNFRLYANSNRTISTYGKKLKKSDEHQHLTESEFNRLCQNSSLGGIIMAIEMLLLKKINQQQYSINQLNENTSLKRMIDINILEQTNYIHEFSQYFYSYGSVRELINFLNEKCEDFLQSNLINERRKKLERLINLKKERNVASFTMIGPILSVAFTLILSLPTLEQLLKLVNKEELLLESYISINIIFILIISWFLKEQIKESYITFNKTSLPKIKRVSFRIQIILFLKTYDLSVFMNRDIRTFFAKG